MDTTFSLKAKSLVSGAKRVKISRACDECRKRKVKCDGVQPCHRCTKNNNDCVFAKLPPKKGPPKQYMEMLENRLSRVERVLRSMTEPVRKVFEDALVAEQQRKRPSVDLSSMMVLPLASEAPTYAHNNKNKVSCAAPYITTTDMMDRFTINEIGQATYVNDLHVRTDRIPNEHQYQHQHQHHCHYDTQSDLASISDSPISTSTASFYQLPQPPPPPIITTHLTMEVPIPDHLISSRELIFELQSLTEIYFDHVHKYLPMIHKPTFLKQMNHTTAAAAPCKMLLYAMCAVASRWSPDHLHSQNATTPAGYTYYTRALELLDDMLDTPRLSTIQALMLIVKYQEYYQRKGYHHRSYFYLGIAARMCYDLDLGQLDSTEYHSHETEQKRRAFWIVFMYDLLSSIEQGRIPYFPSVPKTGFPMVTGEEGPTLEEYIINQNIFIQLVKVISEIYSMTRRITQRQAMQQDQRTNEQTVEEQVRLFSLQTHLENVLYEVPPCMMYPPTSDVKSYPADKHAIGDPYIGFLHMTYHFSVILLHRTYLSSPPPTSTHEQEEEDEKEQEQEEEQEEEEEEEGEEAQFIPYAHRKLCASSASNVTMIAETLYETYPTTIFHHPIRGVSHTLHCLASAATIHKYEMIYSDNEVTRINAKQQYMRSLDLMHQLTSLSPAVQEIMPCFDQPHIQAMLEEKRQASTTSQQQQSFHFAPEQPVVAITPDTSRVRRNTVCAVDALYQSSASIDMRYQQQQQQQQQWQLEEETQLYNKMSWSSTQQQQQQPMYYQHQQQQTPSTFPMEMVQHSPSQQKIYYNSTGGGRVRRHTVSTPSDEQQQQQQQQAYYASITTDHHAQFMMQPQQQMYIKTEYTGDMMDVQDTIMMDSQHYDPSSDMSQLFLTDNNQQHLSWTGGEAAVATRDVISDGTDKNMS